METRCVCETRMPLTATKSILDKNLNVLNVYPPHPQEYMMPEKCEYHFGEQFRLLCHQLNFKYCTLNVSGIDGQSQC